MPVQVDIPVRLRVDAEALALHQGVVDGAVSRALTRALARSRKEVPDRFGGFFDVHVAPLSIRWSGEALDEVVDTTRAATQERIAALIGQTIDEAGLQPGGKVTLPLSEDPVERVDRRRQRMFGRYVVDSYDGNTTTLPTDGETFDTVLPVAVVWDMGVIGEVVNLRWLQFRLAVERGVRKLDDTPAGSGPTGLILRYPDHWDVYVTTDDFKTESKTRVFNFPPQKLRHPKRHGREIVFEEILSIPPPRPCYATETPLPAGLDERRELLRALMGPQIRTEISDTYKPDDAADEDVISEGELRQLIDAKVEDELDQLAKAISKEATVLIRLDWSDISWNITLPSSLASAIGWTGPAQLMPVTAEQEIPARIIGTDGEGATSRRRDAKGEGGDRGTGGDGQGSRYGVGTGGGSGEHLFPSFGFGITLVCEPFEDAEPEPEALGSAGKYLATLVAEIAERLDIPPCKYAATFCVNAALALEPRANAVGLLADFDTKGNMTQSPSGTRGALGSISFAPVASPSIQLLRRLAQAAARIAELRRRVSDVYMSSPGAHLLGSWFAREPNGNVSWTLRFEEAVSPAMKAGVGAIFTQTCQVIMLQLLVTSAEQIAARQRNLHAYAGIFQELLVRRLSSVVELTALRDRLKAVEISHAISGATPVVGGVPGLEWFTAAQALANACVATEGFAHEPGGAHDIVWKDGVARIRDSHGFLWTRQALEEQIVRQRGEAESIDPLIEQLADLPETVELFRQNPAAAETLLSALLEDMASKNREKQEEARGDSLFGLQAGRISEDSSSDQVPGAPYRLAGVHLLAHQEIGEFFRGDPAYGEGIDHAFSVELGKQGLIHFFEFTGLVLLSVLCPPAAFIAGVELAVVEVVKAESRADLYRALINPELVLNRAEIELERYIAYAGLVLSLLPEATTAIRAASVGVRGAARIGVVGGLRIAGRSIMRAASKQVTEALTRELLPTLVREVATQLVMDQVVQAVVGPVIESIERELQLRTSVGGRQGAMALIDQIERSAKRRAEAPLPPEFAIGGP